MRGNRGRRRPFGKICFAQRELLSGLSDDKQTKLAGLLRRFAASLELKTLRRNGSFQGYLNALKPSKKGRELSPPFGQRARRRYRERFPSNCTEALKSCHPSPVQRMSGANYATIPAKSRLQFAPCVP